MVKLNIALDIVKVSELEVIKKGHFSGRNEGWEAEVRNNLEVQNIVWVSAA